MPKIQVLRMAWNDYDIITPGDATTDNDKFEFGSILFRVCHTEARAGRLSNYMDKIKRVNHYINTYMTWEVSGRNNSKPDLLTGSERWTVDLDRDIPRV